MKTQTPITEKYEVVDILPSNSQTINEYADSSNCTYQNIHYHIKRGSLPDKVVVFKNKLYIIPASQN